MRFMAAGSWWAGGPDRGRGRSSAGFPFGDAVRGGGCALAGAETAPGGAPGGPGFGAPVGGQGGDDGQPPAVLAVAAGAGRGGGLRAARVADLDAHVTGLGRYLQGDGDGAAGLARLAVRDRVADELGEMTSLASCTCGWSSPSAWLTSARASRGGLRRSGQLGVHAGTRGSARGHGVAFAVWAAVTRVLARPPGRGDGPGDLAVAEPGPGGRGGEVVEAAGLPGFDGPARGPEQPGVAVALA